MLQRYIKPCNRTFNPVFSPTCGPIGLYRVVAAPRRGTAEAARKPSTTLEVGACCGHWCDALKVPHVQEAHRSQSSEYPGPLP